jgi:hypothetical protein
MWNPGPLAREREALRECLPSQLQANPDLMLAEHRELFEEAHDLAVSTAKMSLAFKRLGLPLKKSLFAERDEAERVRLAREGRLEPAASSSSSTNAARTPR